MKCKNCKNLKLATGDGLQTRLCDIYCKYYDENKEHQCNSYNPRTHADRIRNMTDNELIRFIRAVSCDSRYGGDDSCMQNHFCHSMNGDWCGGQKEVDDPDVMNWLNSRVDGE